MSPVAHKEDFLSTWNGSHVQRLRLPEDLIQLEAESRAQSASSSPATPESPALQTSRLHRNGHPCLAGLLCNPCASGRALKHPGNQTNALTPPQTQLHGFKSLVDCHIGRDVFPLNPSNCVVFICRLILTKGFAGLRGTLKQALLKRFPIPLYLPAICPIWNSESTASFILSHQGSTTH